MVHINALSVASLALLTTSTVALPFNLPSWMLFGRQSSYQPTAPQFPRIVPTSGQGVFPSGVPVPTGTQVVPFPTGTAFPTGAPTPAPYTDFSKREAQPQYEHHKDHWQPGVFVKRSNNDLPKRQVYAPLPIGTASSGFPAPTGSYGPWTTGTPGEQEKQFGGVRHKGFKPHWTGTYAEYPIATPTASGAASPTGTGF